MKWHTELRRLENPHVTLLSYARQTYARQTSAAQIEANLEDWTDAEILYRLFEEPDSVHLG